MREQPRVQAWEGGERNRLAGDTWVYMKTDKHDLGTRGTQHAPNNGERGRGQFN